MDAEMAVVDGGVERPRRCRVPMRSQTVAADRPCRVPVRSHSTIISALEAAESALTVSQVAKLLNISLASAYRQCKSGGLPAFAVGGSIRIDPQLLADYLRQHTRLGIKVA